MNIIYARQPLPKTQKKAIFLAGPTPRDGYTPSWRLEALQILQELGFDGDVFVPESNTDDYKDHYLDQVDWEDLALNRADVILFWIPRDMKTMPALTTNDEYGTWKKTDPAKLVLGVPYGAPHCSYQKHYAEQLGIPFTDSMNKTVKNALEKLGEGVERAGGECDVPLHIWRTPSFQQWYGSQILAGNRLDGAKVEWVFRIPSNKQVFAWIMHVNIFVKSENRNKTNEFVFARTDISTIVAFHRGKSLTDTKIVLVREFRSPASTPDGFILECPGGSSPKYDQDPLTVASEEFHEETGMKIEADRFLYVNEKQLAGTLSTHRAHVFRVELTDEELAVLSRDEAANLVHGAGNSEQTYIRIVSVEELLNGDTDWSTLGMIFSTLLMSPTA